MCVMNSRHALFTAMSHAPQILWTGWNRTNTIPSSSKTDRKRPIRMVEVFTLDDSTLVLMADLLCVCETAFASVRNDASHYKQHLGGCIIWESDFLNERCASLLYLPSRPDLFADAP